MHPDNLQSISDAKAEQMAEEAVAEVDVTNMITAYHHDAEEYAKVAKGMFEKFVNGQDPNALIGPTIKQKAVKRDNQAILQESAHMKVCLVMAVSAMKLAGLVDEGGNLTELSVSNPQIAEAYIRIKVALDKSDESNIVVDRLQKAEKLGVLLMKKVGDLESCWGLAEDTIQRYAEGTWDGGERAREAIALKKYADELKQVKAEDNYVHKIAQDILDEHELANREPGEGEDPPRVLDM